MTELTGVYFHKGKLWHYKSGGLGSGLGEGLDSIKIDLFKNSKSSVIMVHGFRYDPTVEGEDNPYNSVFKMWNDNIINYDSAFGFGWWSCPGGKRLLSTYWQAVKAGRWNTYRYAWDLAEEAGIKLAELIKQSSGPVIILCHSLGTRVVLSAIEHDATLPINRVVLMNGAELCKNAIWTSNRRKYIRFFNLVVKEDDMLKKFGALLAPGDLYAVTIGQAGLGIEAPTNWTDIDLDLEKTKVWAKNMGWPNVEGNNPNSYFDHWWTSKHPGNWPLIRGLLFNGDIIPLRL